MAVFRWCSMGLEAETQNYTLEIACPLYAIPIQSDPPLESDPMIVVERAYKNSLKQALFLQHGSAKVAMSLKQTIS
jgi:hypothetical protein